MMSHDMDIHSRFCLGARKDHRRTSSDLLCPSNMEMTGLQAMSASQMPNNCTGRTLSKVASTHVNWYNNTEILTLDTKIQENSCNGVSIAEIEFCLNFCPICRPSQLSRKMISSGIGLMETRGGLSDQSGTQFFNLANNYGFSMLDRRHLICRGNRVLSIYMYHILQVLVTRAHKISCISLDGTSIRKRNMEVIMGLMTKVNSKPWRYHIIVVDDCIEHVKCSYWSILAIMGKEAGLIMHNIEEQLMKCEIRKKNDFFFPSKSAFENHDTVYSMAYLDDSTKHLWMIVEPAVSPYCFLFPVSNAFAQVRIGKHAGIDVFEISMAFVILDDKRKVLVIVGEDGDIIVHNIEGNQHQDRYEICCVDGHGFLVGYHWKHTAIEKQNAYLGMRALQRSTANISLILNNLYFNIMCKFYSHNCMRSNRSFSKRGILFSNMLREQIRNCAIIADTHRANSKWFSDEWCLYNIAAEIDIILNCGLDYPCMQYVNETISSICTHFPVDEQKKMLTLRKRFRKRNAFRSIQFFPKLDMPNFRRVVTKKVYEVDKIICNIMFLLNVKEILIGLESTRVVTNSMIEKKFIANARAGERIMHSTGLNNQSNLKFFKNRHNHSKKKIVCSYGKLFAKFPTIRRSFPNSIASGATNNIGVNIWSATKGQSPSKINSISCTSSHMDRRIYITERGRLINVTFNQNLVSEDLRSIISQNSVDACIDGHFARLNSIIEFGYRMDSCGNIVSEGGLFVNECANCIDSEGNLVRQLQNFVSNMRIFSCNISHSDMGKLSELRAFARNTNLQHRWNEALSFVDTQGISMNIDGHENTTLDVFLTRILDYIGDIKIGEINVEEECRQIKHLKIKEASLYQKQDKTHGIHVLDSFGNIVEDEILVKADGCFFHSRNYLRNAFSSIERNRNFILTEIVAENKTMWKVRNNFGCTQQANGLVAGCTTYADSVFGILDVDCGDIQTINFNKVYLVCFKEFSFKKRRWRCTTHISFCDFVLRRKIYLLVDLSLGSL